MLLFCRISNFFLFQKNNYDYSNVHVNEIVVKNTVVQVISLSYVYIKIDLVIIFTVG